MKILGISIIVVGLILTLLTGIFCTNHYEGTVTLTDQEFTWISNKINLRTLPSGKTYVEATIWGVIPQLESIRTKEVFEPVGFIWLFLSAFGLVLIIFVEDVT